MTSDEAALGNRVSVPAIELGALLAARDADSRDRAWERFVRRHSRIIYHAARSLGGDRDAVMDRYAYLLDELARDDCRRLRAWSPDGGSRFTTWLVAVCRRLCIDHWRQRHGRPRGDRSDDPAWIGRRNLLTGIGIAAEGTQLHAPDADDPEQAVIANDRNRRLAAAVAELTAQDRLLLALRFRHDRSAREIASVLDLPTPFHVYRRLNGVLARLRARLVAQGLDRDTI